jgi:WD40 domain-containing protein
VTLRDVLDELPVDGGAEERAWAVVRAAYAERERAAPAGSAFRRRWTAAAAVALAAVVAAAVSSPGRAVVDAVRRTIGVSHASPALFRLPAPGRLLVSGRGGTWVVAADGSKRRLGSYPQAAWSPHGLFVVASTRTQLAAIDPRNGGVHWSLARPAVAFPRWGGTRTDTRLAYVSRGTLRVVAGDGTGDHAVAQASAVPAVWQPERHVLAYAAGRRIVVYDADAGRVVAQHRLAGARALAWSRDGTELAAASRREVAVYRGGKRSVLPLAGVRALAFSRDGRLAVVRGRAVLVVDGEGVQTLFTAPGPLAGIAWSPDGRWLVTALPGADQWIFLGGRRVLAVSHISSQLGGDVSLDGWMPGA